MKSKNFSSFGRRRFLGAMAGAVGLTHVLDEVRLSASQIPSAPANVRLVSDALGLSSEKAVLTAADFSYMGAMRLPTESVDLSFSYGAMTARKVNGRLHFFLAQSITTNFTPTPHAVVEVADTGDYRTNYLDAPRAPIVQNWGDIYQGKRLSWDSSGGVINLNSSQAMVTSLLYRDGRLYWSYYDGYNVAGRRDWHLGFTALNGGPSSMQAYGPWRTIDGVHKLGHYCVALPDGSLGLSASLSSGNVQSSWGPILKGGVSYPTETTRAGVGSPDLAAPHTYVEHGYPTGDLNDDGTLVSGRTLKSMAREGDYVWHSISSSSGQANASRNYLDPVKNGGRGSWTDIDYFNGLIYLNLPNKHGVLFVGSMGTGHTWYGRPDDCGHGFSSASLTSGTGPNASSFRSWWGVYDPAKMAAVAAGQRNPTFPPDVQFDPSRAIAPLKLGAGRSFGGMHFDSETSMLYVLSREAEQVGLMYIPLIHVFRVVG